MDRPDLTPIDNVLASLDAIIAECMQREDPLGYFACLYRRVTARVKDKIERGVFENGTRMVELDVVFAARYLDAYHAYQTTKPISQSWLVAFDYARKLNGIVLQHLLLGMNAHINLDLGIAAAQISQGKPIGDLHGDFNKINEILAELVGDVQDGLSSIWPFLKRILTRTKQFDDYLVDFSMELARDGAWKFATELDARPDGEWGSNITARDIRIAEVAGVITRPKTVIQIILWCIRLGERGSVSAKIGGLTARD